MSRLTEQERRAKRHAQLSKYIGYKVGQALKKHRKDHGLNNEKMAEMIGCHPQTFSKYCGMNSDMRLDSFLKVVKAFNLSIEDLIKGTEYEY